MRIQKLMRIFVRAVEQSCPSLVFVVGVDWSKLLQRSLLFWLWLGMPYERYCSCIQTNGCSCGCLQAEVVVECII